MYVVADKNLIIDGQGHPVGHVFMATDTKELQDAIKAGLCHVPKEDELKKLDSTDKARAR